MRRALRIGGRLTWMTMAFLRLVLGLLVLILPPALAVALVEHFFVVRWGWLVAAFLIGLLIWFEVLRGLNNRD